MIVRASPPEHYAWLIQRTSLAPTAGFRAIEAVDTEGNIRGMVGFDFWMPNSCQVHMAVDAPIAWRRLVYAAAEYIFEEAGKSVMLGLTRATNTPALRVIKAFGFKEVARVREGFGPGEDLVISELRKELCRFPRRERKAA